VTELRGIKEANGGLEIGAMTTLTEVANSALVKERYALLAEAAGLVASPQIRNQGTMGGNVSQDARCWYYRAGWPCYRAGGNICYADTPTSVNREHAIFDADRCVAVNPSDTAPALIALDAEMVVNRGGSELVVPAQDFFVGTGVDITRLTILQPGDLLTAVRIPGTWAGKQFYFEKVRDRQVWDFALVNIASAINASGNSISEARLVVNGVSARPFRLEAVEAFVRGKGRDEQTAEQAGELAVQGAVPLRHNAYKVPLMKNLVKRAIRGAGAWSS
jgi:xanthine dehydrogenase YagS FAD-binding subunit